MASLVYVVNKIFTRYSELKNKIEKLHVTSCSRLSVANGILQESCHAGYFVKPDPTTVHVLTHEVHQGIIKT